MVSSVRQETGGDDSCVFRSFRPAAALSDFVQGYTYEDTEYLVGRPRPYAVSLRPIIKIHLGSAGQAFEYAAARHRLLPRVLVLGPCDHRVADLVDAGRNTNFIIKFHPTGFYRLFGMSPAAMRNYAQDGCDVLGHRMASLLDRLGGLSDPGAMAAAVDDVLSTWLSTAIGPSRLQGAVDNLVSGRGRYGLGQLAREVETSQSSLRRHFVTQIGLPPKRLLQILRFQTAATLKELHPHLSWTRVGLEAGYYDQSHFITEFRAMSGAAPSSFMGQLSTLPEFVRRTYFSR